MEHLHKNTPPLVTSTLQEEHKWSHDQRITVQPVLEDQTITKPRLKKWLENRASDFELIDQLTAGYVIATLAKATKVTYGELHDHCWMAGLRSYSSVNVTLLNFTYIVRYVDMKQIWSRQCPNTQCIERCIKKFLDADKWTNLFFNCCRCQRLLIAIGWGFLYCKALFV